MKAFVTGGTGTIGSLIIKELVEQGHKVYFQYGNNEKTARELEEKYGARGIKILLELGEKNIELQKYDIPNDCAILINCVGAHIVVEEAENVNLSDIEQLFKINVVFPFAFIKYFLPYMKSSAYGRIVNISSICGLSIGENNIPYVVSKHAFSALTKCIAAEYKDYNIRCNEVCPSAIQSKMNEMILSTESQLYGVALSDYIKQEQPQGALSPATVINAILYLISEKSDPISGISLVIDNGNAIV